ncbi:alpha,alpha-trehalose-phosphate synthase (UDP-forming) [Acidisoma cladoniae]|uniref:alpha,alpha-trehalose-phosphate synthase (UDP-forming) n=1 Tax=Acidisoma cladoniae TaxID=3040935 RepID=UPI0025510173|nr:trehalose-6-phosphate synthase [Acidisoma sp. PAMC 29798]
MSRLVIVSNRVQIPTEKAPRAGGLAVALGSGLQPGTLWFGWSGKKGHSVEGRTPTLHDALGVTYATVDLTEKEYHEFYVGFSNGALWPLLHYRLDFLDYHRNEYAGYRAVNAYFADALLPILNDDDLVWVHDYHLFTMGQEMRARGAKHRIGFFLHIPFVPPELLDALPCGIELLKALCAYDVVGFHTDDHKHAFLACITDMLHIVPDADDSFVYEGRRVKAISDPIGIDAEEFAATAARSVRGAEVKRIRESLFSRALVIGADRLDYSKGLPNRFRAFDQLLERFDEHRGKVSMLQVAARSREDVDRYQQLRRTLDRLVGDINGRYSEFDWIPIRYMTRALSRKSLAGFYRVARVGLVTPLRDGMNLVAKEYVAAQSSADPGVLILSRFAGAADELREALLVNPFDADEVAEAINQAINMELPERKERWQALREKVWAGTPQKFTETFLVALRP